MEACIRTRRIVLVVTGVLFGLVAPRVISAQQGAPDSVRIARLTAVGRLWGVVKYFHPAVTSGAVRWDSATAASVEAIRAAGSADEYLAAVTTLLATLHDPATRILPLTVAPSPGPLTTTRRWIADGADSTLVIAIPVFDRSTTATLRGFSADLRSAQRVVFDLRGPRPINPRSAVGIFAASGVDSLLPAGPIAVPPERSRMYSGFPNQSQFGSPLYWAGNYDLDGQRFTARKRARRIVFLANSWSDIPPIAFALRTNGQGAIVVSGASRVLEASATVYRFPIGEGRRVEVRVAEIVGGEADTVVSESNGSEQVLNAAVALAHRPVAPPVGPVLTATSPVMEPAPAALYPSTGYRVLAAYELWNAIRYFYPYRDLLGEDWNAVLPLGIARLERARDSLDYEQGVAEMAAHIHDTHAKTGGPALQAFYGTAVLGIDLLPVNGQIVVSSLMNDSATVASGIAVGDVVLKIDGQDVAARRASIERFFSTSTPQSHELELARILLVGQPGTAHLTIRDRRNVIREVTLPRTEALTMAEPDPKTHPIMKILPGNIGYVDLSRLQSAMVDSMFELFRHTVGIVFDDRGYPQGTAAPIASRLTNGRAVPVARFDRPLVMFPDTSRWSTHSFVQSVSASAKWPYLGRTVLLIDARAVSQSEHLGLYLKAANHTTFIGSPTTGANGDVTGMELPGMMEAFFTGQGVRHVDGSQLQRVGLKPDILVRPTLAGLRAGRDEVLDRAVRFLLTPPTGVRH